MYYLSLFRILFSIYTWKRLSKFQIKYFSRLKVTNFNESQNQKWFVNEIVNLFLSIFVSPCLGLSRSSFVLSLCANEAKSIVNDSWGQLWIRTPMWSEQIINNLLVDVKQLIYVNTMVSICFQMHLIQFKWNHCQASIWYIWMFPFLPLVVATFHNCIFFSLQFQILWMNPFALVCFSCSKCLDKQSFMHHIA